MITQPNYSFCEQFTVRKTSFSLSVYPLIRHPSNFRLLNVLLVEQKTFKVLRFEIMFQAITIIILI